MAIYYVEAVVHGRVSFAVEADSESEAIEKAWESPDFPSFDKVYESDVNLIGSADETN